MSNTSPLSVATTIGNMVIASGPWFLALNSVIQAILLWCVLVGWAPAWPIKFSLTGLMSHWLMASVSRHCQHCLTEGWRGKRESDYLRGDDRYSNNVRIVRDGGRHLGVKLAIYLLLNQKSHMFGKVVVVRVILFPQVLQNWRANA